MGAYGGYTHINKPSGEVGLYVGKKGSEVQVATSAGLILLAGSAIGLTKAELESLSGITASAAEINILDDCTATYAELNTMHGTAATAAEMDYRIMTLKLADAGTAEKLYAVVPITGDLITAYTCNGGVQATSNATVLVKDHAGATAATITIANSGAAAGDVDSAAVTTNNTFTAGQLITVETDGVGSCGSPCMVTLLFEIT